MLDTKLKSRHKLAVVIVIAAVILAMSAMAGSYQMIYKHTVSGRENARENYLSSEGFLESFVESSYILYHQENKGKKEEGPWAEITAALYPYVDYQVQDGEENVLDKNLADSEGMLSQKKLSSYKFGLSITYDKQGTPDIDTITGPYKDRQQIVLKRILRDGNISEGIMSGLAAPRDRTYIYAMTEENLQAYLDDNYFDSSVITAAGVNTVLGIAAFLCILAFLLPLWRSLRTGEERIFHAPFELAAVVIAIMIGLLGNWGGWLFTRAEGRFNGLDFAVWGVSFLLIYWAASCLRQIWVIGIRRYIKERTLLVPLCHSIKRGCSYIWQRGKEGLDKLYHSVDDIDFNEKDNRIILKIVVINFVVLLVLCSLWVFGIVGLIIYSVLLFVILRKYFNDLRGKYAVLLKATNAIAEGDLDTEITEDLGVFQPFKAEIKKIQSGFQKAVKEEVKGQRLKTELITNVSHDLKTPLTAIITYVNLLKEETDEEKRRAYTEVLEQKSLRLKDLIEDLFEISKASSDNVKLDLVNIDIVNLYKQVQLEQSDKIEQAGLTFRCSYPEEKIILRLDSQKTYRIFENLLVNITKYAMPHTRVYVAVSKEGEDVVIQMKNISSTELAFDPGELTDRFVRGDVARNTEGSGLGLAIVKSFVELQKGSFKIETEADLFKAEIRWKCTEK